MEKKKSIPAIVQDISDQICTKYCKWPEKCLAKVKDPDEAEGLLETYCEHCPLQLLT